MIHPRNQPLFGNDSVTVTETYPTDDIRYLFNKLNNSAVHKRRKNYLIDEAVEKQTIAYSVTYLNDRPALGSIAWYRPIYGNAIRIMTKYCVDPELEYINFGKGTENLLRLDVIDHMNQQIVIAKQHGYNIFFISQEDKIKGKRVRKMADTMTKHTDYIWHVTDKPVLVAPNPDDPSCWQYVISNGVVDFDYSAYPHIQENTNENY